MVRLNLNDEKKFKQIYGSNEDAHIAHFFGINVEQVDELAQEMGLFKNKTRFIGIKMPRWSKKEVRRLKRMHPNYSNLEIALVLGRSVKSVVSKAYHMGLKKSPERLIEMGSYNVSLRRDRDS